MLGWANIKLDNRRDSIVAYGGLSLITAIGLYYLSQANYLLFHSVVEGYSTVIAFAIFIQGWNSRRYMENGYLLLLGIAYLFVGLLDFLHFLAYSGMGVFSSEGANLPTQLWLASRYLESLAVLSAFYFIDKRLRGHGALGVFGLLTALILASIFYWGIFPECYGPGTGLTDFKIYSEYIICLLLFCGLIMLYRNHERLDSHVRVLVAWSLLLTILTELTFTQYVNVFGIVNMLGHLLKIASFYLIYKAIVFTGFTRPMDLQFKELKEKDARLFQDLATIQAMEKERDIVLSLLVHDMKTPLISIKGFSNLLLNKPERLDSAKQIEYAKVIFRQSERLESLIHDFLISSKRGENKLALNLRECDVCELLQEMGPGFAERCERASLTLKIEGPANPAPILLDCTRFQRVLDNLLDNAIRFSPKGASIRLMASIANGNLEIEVRDQGPGIPDEDLDLVFRPFYRGKDQRDGTGYGLGLAGVKTIVESHGGSVCAGNAQSGGAVFTVSMPCQPGEA